MFRGISKRIIVLTLLFLLLDVVLIPHFGLRNYSPSFLLVLVVFYAFYVDWENVPYFAFLVGLLREVFSNSAFGLQIISFLIGAFVLRFLLRKVDRESLSMQLLATAIFSVLVLSVFNVGFLMMKSRFSLFLCDWSKIFLVSGINTALSFFVFLWFGRKMKVRDRQYELFNLD